MEPELIVRRTKLYLTTTVYNKIQLGCAVVRVLGVAQFLSSMRVCFQKKSAQVKSMDARISLLIFCSTGGG